MHLLSRISGFVFDKCTTLSEGDARPWCPTKLSSADGDYSLGSNDWGYCNPRCPFIDATGRTVEGTTPRPGSLRKNR